MAYFMDSAALRWTLYCSNAALASVTEAKTFEPAHVIASGMPTSESAIPNRGDP